MHCIGIFQNHLSRGKHVLSVHQPHMLWLSVWSKGLANLPWCSKASDRNKNLLPLYSSDTILNLPKPTNPTTSLTWPTLSQNCIVPGEAQLTALMKTLPTLLNLYICLVIRNGWTGELINLLLGKVQVKKFIQQPTIIFDLEKPGQNICAWLCSSYPDIRSCCQTWQIILSWQASNQEFWKGRQPLHCQEQQ
jgi:hypothetical protein